MPSDPPTAGGSQPMINQRALSQYKTVNVDAGVAAASPHRLVQMLMAGALTRMAEARGALARHDRAAYGEAVGKAISVVGGLREGLNLELDNPLVNNLDGLYDYMQRRLTEANLSPDDAILDELSGLLRTVKEGWDGIADQVG